MNSFDTSFPRYKTFSPHVPVWCLTPGVFGCFHRFFDTSPISPSGRYLAVTKLRTEARMPAPDDEADIMLVDLDSGMTFPVATTSCFDTQLGANVQWGARDTELFFNDLRWDSGKPIAHAVRFDPLAGKRVDLDGPVYMVSPDGKKSASPSLLRMPLTQPGYGAVVLPSHLPYNHGTPSDDGIFLTDNESGASELFISLQEIVGQIEEELSASFSRAGVSLQERDFYGFHVKWNPQGDRILFVIRARNENPRERLLNAVVTIETATKRVYLAMAPDLWSRGGHHPQWHPDGEHIIMNLKYPGEEMRFVRYRYDGTGLEVIADPVHGGGHPSIHPNGRSLITDEYEHGPLAYPDGTTQIRFVDIPSATATEIIRIRTRPDYHARGRELRIDPHPAWDRTFRFIVFNACPEGKRQVFLADLATIMT